MKHPKAQIIAQLQREILPLQGLKHRVQEATRMTGLNMMADHFPNQCFPLGAVHEFFCQRAEDLSATSGFVAGILSSLMQDGGVTLWISRSPLVFPPALVHFGVTPHNIIFLHLQKETEMLWAVEEALKCNCLAAVVGEISELSFTASRRFQIAVESSGVTCLLLRYQPSKTTTAAVARWRIQSLPSPVEEGLPGVGFPRWQVALLKIRNGRPGSWPLEWAGNGFKLSYPALSVASSHFRKTG